MTGNLFNQKSLTVNVHIHVIHKCNKHKTTTCIKLLPIINYDFQSDCPSLNHGTAIRYVQHSHAVLQSLVYELAHSFFIKVHFYVNQIDIIICSFLISLVFLFFFIQHKLSGQLNGTTITQKV